MECHEGKESESGVDLAKMTAEASLEGTFKNWQKAVAILKQGKMPPKDADQPSDTERNELIGQIEGALRQAMDERAGDPGAVVVRRLTSAEYGYTIQDLTGQTLNLEQDFAGDGVGGEGFTNVGSASLCRIRRWSGTWKRPSASRRMR